MSELVDPIEIEVIVGVARNHTFHLARAISADHTVYILHSQECKDSGIDLRQCVFSQALDRGIDVALWQRLHCEDRVVALAVMGGELLPVKPSWLDTQTVKKRSGETR